MRYRTVIAWQSMREAGYSGKQASQKLGVARSTVYRWQKRLRERNLRGLEDDSRRPKRLRTVSWQPELIETVLDLREMYPRWGKEKLCVLLEREGWHTSASTVGRILSYLRKRGLLYEPLKTAQIVKRRRKKRPYALRKPKNYRVEQPGDLVQIDTLDVKLMPGVHFKHFTARDMISRWDVLQACSRATANNAMAFLETVQVRLPFPLKAVQVDGGSEFMAEFEQACQEKGIRLFVLPPRSPKLNGCVERAQRTHTEEFYQVYADDWELPVMNKVLQDWERIYNEVRPHHSLDNLTPKEYIQTNYPQCWLQVSHMY
ncbi:MAG: integrase core domain-containing protein [Eudoraea sp.]|nr:integrase core domain-containing protein [Eudoraea sp.]